VTIHDERERKRTIIRKSKLDRLSHASERSDQDNSNEVDNEAFSSSKGHNSYLEMQSGVSYTYMNASSQFSSASKAKKKKKKVKKKSNNNDLD